MMNELFRHAQDSNQLFGPASQPINSMVLESVLRINAASENLKEGWYRTVNLSPYRQQEGNTCFFSGSIAMARDFLGTAVAERPLAQRARELGLLNPYGAVTTDGDKRIEIERFIKAETGIRIRFHQPSWGDQQQDLRLLNILTTKGNAALVLYATSPETCEWETFFGVRRLNSEPGVRWYSNFSATGITKERNTPQMASLLYGIPQNPYLLICEIQIQTPVDPIT